MTDWRNRITGQGEEDPEQLLANPGNWRIHPRTQQDAMTGVLEEVGWVQNIIVNRQTGHVVDGHLRVSLALRNHSPKVPVVYVDLSLEEESLVLATLDPIAAMAGTDKAKLETLLKGIDTENQNIAGLIENIAATQKIDLVGELADAEPQIDRAEELNKKWQVKRGDLWRIGEHRLLCGDCTVRENVERVMGGEKAGACVTDSPYGINRDGIENDDPEGLRKLFDGCLANMPIENGVIINFQSPRLFWIWLDALKVVGQKFERALWMHRRTGKAYPFHGWVIVGDAISISTIGKPEWGQPRQHLFDCYVKESLEPHDLNGLHSTIKPVDVVMDLIEHTTGNIYEPFAGSGTTLVACQNLSRRCRAIEISPAYCAVALERMATAFPSLEIERL